MSIIKISPSPLKGEITLPPSKSVTHRALICAALSGGKCKLSPVDMESQDIQATMGALETLGAAFHFNGDVLFADGSGMFKSDREQIIDCNESGSTLRFLLPLAAAGGVSARFEGKGRLPERPLDIFHDILPLHGVKMSGKTLPLQIDGRLLPGEYKIPGNVSSQFISGILMALPILSGESVIKLTSPLESAGYVDMTVDVMKQFGADVECRENYYRINSGQNFIPRDFEIESDWSQAAFFIAANFLGSDVDIQNLNPDSSQGDKEIANIIKNFTANQSDDIVINCAQIPDLVPAIAVCAAKRPGKTLISGGERLRIKESDRIKAMCDGLKSLGCGVLEKPDGMEIIGSKLRGGFVNGCNDHRIVMAFSVLASSLNESVTISDCESVKKSYPNFFKEFRSLGGLANVIDDR